jgi:hypothetical protein
LAAKYNVLLILIPPLPGSNLKPFEYLRKLLYDFGLSTLFSRLSSRAIGLLRQVSYSISAAAGAQLIGIDAIDLSEIGRLYFLLTQHGKQGGSREGTFRGHVAHVQLLHERARMRRGLARASLSRHRLDGRIRLHVDWASCRGATAATTNCLAV